MDLDKTLRRFDVGRAATIRELRELADRLEAMPLPDVVEALTWLQPPLAALQRWSDASASRLE